jgi:hypothetical protein
LLIFYQTTAEHLIWFPVAHLIFSYVPFSFALKLLRLFEILF